MVSLIKKRGLSVHDPANYRPITDQHTFSEILEKLFFFRLQPHIMESCNYCKFQSAYRNGCSTETALVKVVNDIRRAAGDSQCTVLLALDISAAFDAVDHTTLVERARTVFSINGTSLDWLRSIVTQRSQFTAVGTKRSEDLRARRCRRTILNPDKTEAVVFGTRKRLQKYRRLLDSH